MSEDKLVYPRDPAGSGGVGDRMALLDLLQLARQVFFPRLGKGLHERVAELEGKVAALEAKQKALENQPP